jgi:amino acid transporter
VFWIKPINTDPRFGLCVGGLFAAIGNKYIVESIVPSTNEVTLLDNLHNITFVAIFFIIIISVISLNIYERDTEKSMKLSKRIDVISFISIVSLYMILLVTSINQTLHSH